MSPKITLDILTIAPAVRSLTFVVFAATHTMIHLVFLIIQNHFNP